MSNLPLPRGKYCPSATGKFYCRERQISLLLTRAGQNTVSVCFSPTSMGCRNTSPDWQTVSESHIAIQLPGLFRVHLFGITERRRVSLGRCLRDFPDRDLIIIAKNLHRNVFSLLTLQLQHGSPHIQPVDVFDGSFCGRSLYNERAAVHKQRTLIGRLKGRIDEIHLNCGGSIAHAYNGLHHRKNRLCAARRHGGYPQRRTPLNHNIDGRLTG